VSGFPAIDDVHHEAALGVLELSEVGIEGRGARGAARRAGPEAGARRCLSTANRLAFRLVVNDCTMPMRMWPEST